MKKIIVLCICSFFLVGISTGHAKPFYEGKVITLIVSTKPGGGYDFYGRMMAKFMQDELKGSTIIVKNLPGAGHIIGTNAMYKAKPDGLTFSIFNSGIIASQLVGQKGVKFDVRKMSWLGATGMGPYAFIVTPEKFKTYEDVKKAERVLITCSGIGSLAYVVPSLFIKMADLQNVAMSTGYGGTESEMAMLRGESDGQFASWDSVSSFVKEGNAVPVLFVEQKEEGYENVPSMKDVIPDQKYRSIIDFIDLIACSLIRPFAGPPGIPADRLKVLRQTFAKVLQNPDYQKIMHTSGQRTGYFSPEQTNALVSDIFKMSPENLELIKSVYTQKN